MLPGRHAVALPCSLGYEQSWMVRRHRMTKRSSGIVSPGVAQSICPCMDFVLAPSTEQDSDTVCHETSSPKVKKERKRAAYSKCHKIIAHALQLTVPSQKALFRSTSTIAELHAVNAPRASPELFGRVDRIHGVCRWEKFMSGQFPLPEGKLFPSRQ